LDAHRGGWIEIIAGGMFSGKSEELIRRLRRAVIARQRVQVFKPLLDDRFATDEVVSRDERRLKAVAVATSAEMLARIEIGVQVVGIDEVQFFDPEIVSVIERLADGGVRVVVAGLDQDYAARPFDPMPQLLALAEYVTKSLAICSRCGAPAGRSQRMVATESRVLVGAADAYEPRCRRCHSKHAEPRTGSLF